MRPDYSDSLESRTTMHDVCETKLRELLDQAGYDPEPKQSDGALFDVKTQTLLMGCRHIFDVKIMRADWTVAIAGANWQVYPTGSNTMLLVIGRHRDGEPTMLVTAEEIADFDHTAEDLPSGDWGYRFEIPPRPVFTERMEQLRSEAFLAEPAGLWKTRRCSTCGFVLPVSAFDKNRTNSSGFQSNCRDCDHEIRRLNLWYQNGGIFEWQVRNAMTVQEHRCGGCGQDLLLSRARLRWDRDTRVAQGFTHRECQWERPDTTLFDINGEPLLFEPLRVDQMELAL